MPRHLAARQRMAPALQTSLLKDPERSLPHKPNSRHPKTHLAVLSGTVSWPRTSSRVIVRSTNTKLSKSEECVGNPCAGRNPQSPMRAHHQRVRQALPGEPFYRPARRAAASWREAALPLASARFLMQMRRQACGSCQKATWGGVRGMTQPQICRFCQSVTRQTGACRFHLAFLFC